MYADVYARIVDVCVAAAPHIRFISENSRSRIKIGLYGSVLDIGYSIKLNIKSETGTVFPLLLRPMLEAYVELRNILEDGDYENNILLRHHKVWIGILESAERGNPYLQGLKDQPNFHSSLRHHRDEKARLQRKGYVDLKIFRKFEKAGMMNEYNAVYSTLSDYTHSGLQAIISRHVIVEDKDMPMTYLKPVDPLSLDITLDTAGRLLLSASRLIHSDFTTGQAHLFDGLERDLDAVALKPGS